MDALNDRIAIKKRVIDFLFDFLENICFDRIRTRFVVEVCCFSRGEGCGFFNHQRWNVCML